MAKVNINKAPKAAKAPKAELTTTKAAAAAAPVAVTSKEYEVMLGILDSEFNDSERDRSRHVWSWSICCDLPKRSIPGVVASLVKKGLASCADGETRKDDSVCLTDEGLAYVQSKLNTVTVEQALSGIGDAQCALYWSDEFGGNLMMKNTAKKITVTKSVKKVAKAPAKVSSIADVIDIGGGLKAALAPAPVAKAAPAKAAKPDSERQKRIERTLKLIAKGEPIRKAPEKGHKLLCLCGAPVTSSSSIAKNERLCGACCAALRKSKAQAKA